MPASSEPRKPNSARAIIALTGFMAAGKSTVGRSLACLLKWRFVDLDSEIESRCNQAICEIFAQQGEARFRELESEALRIVLQNVSESTVIALGGGTSVQRQNVDLLRRACARVVFLELDSQELLQRCRAAAERAPGNARPLATDEETFCALYAQRLPLYRQADVVIDGHSKTPEQIAREVALTLRLVGDAAT